MIRRTMSVFGLMVIAACGDPATSDAATAKKAADALTGDSMGEASDNPVCKLFNADELEVYAGEPLAGPSNAAGGSGCQWVSQDDEGDVLIQIVPKDYHRNPTLADGYREVPDVGTEGNVTPDMGGWFAAAIVGEESIVVSVAGEGASPDAAIALLRETITRRAK